MKTLRPYQRAACNAFYDHICDGGTAGLIDLATGLGKSYVIATVCKEVIAEYSKTRILMAVHNRELVRQNFQELIELWPQAPAGINSAGLNRRDWQSQIIFGSIQSIYKHTDILGKFDLVVIDECHLLPKSASGMYQSLLANLRDGKPKMRVLGLTATPFRLDSGRLDRGESALFEKTVYSYGIAPGIVDGYLSPLITKAMAAEIDTSKVRRRGGEFISGELEAAAMGGDNVSAAVDEIIQYGADRRAWLAFCVGIKHAQAVHGELVRRGIKSAIVASDKRVMPPDERDKRISAFARGDVRCMVNVSMLTTGFNVPHIDLIALLRPTESPGLAIQMIGRGTRLANGKEKCLVLDFGRILKTHGPIDKMEPAEREKRGNRDGAEPAIRVRICPECNAMMPLTALVCDACGQEFPRQERKAEHDAHADGENVILSTQIKPRWVDVTAWRVSKGKKGEGGPEYLRITYLCGSFGTVNEFLLFDHGGFHPKTAARRWLELSGIREQFTPQTTKEALERKDELLMPAAIQITKDGKYFKVMRSTPRKVTCDEKAA